MHKSKHVAAGTTLLANNQVEGGTQTFIMFIRHYTVGEMNFMRALKCRNTTHYVTINQHARLDGKKSLSLALRHIRLLLMFIILRGSVGPCLTNYFHRNETGPSFDVSVSLLFFFFLHESGPNGSRSLRTCVFRRAY